MLYLISRESWIGCSLAQSSGQGLSQATVRVLARAAVISRPNWGRVPPGWLPWLLLGLRSSVAVGWSHHFPAPDVDLPVEQLTHGGWLPSGGTSERGHSLISKVMSHYFCHLSFVRVKSLGSSHTWQAREWGGGDPRVWLPGSYLRGRFMISQPTKPIFFTLKWG